MLKVYVDIAGRDKRLEGANRGVRMDVVKWYNLNDFRDILVTLVGIILEGLWW